MGFFILLCIFITVVLWPELCSQIHIVPGWGIWLTPAGSCSTGLPGYIGWRGWPVRQPCARVNYIPPVRDCECCYCPQITTPLFSLLFVSKYRSQTPIGQKKTSLTHWFSLQNTHNKDKEKSSGRAHLFNIGTKKAMDRTSGHPKVKLSLMRSYTV